MAEPALREPVPPGPYEIAQAEQPALYRAATQNLFEWLQVRWQDLKDRIANPGAANRPSLVQELRKDAEYLRLRGRFYHEHRPLHVLGMVAAATFVVGLFLGIRRR